MSWAPLLPLYCLDSLCAWELAQPPPKAPSWPPCGGGSPRQADQCLCGLGQSSHEYLVLLLLAGVTPKGSCLASASIPCSSHVMSWQPVTEPDLCL